jgi:AcrR family transcriptional regulator
MKTVTLADGAHVEPGSARAAVTRERIAEAALGLLDEGPDEGALTMRSLATRLGVQAPSLYAHVTGMDDVHDLVHSRINSTIDLSVVQGSSDLDDFAELGRRYRAAYRAHQVAATIIITCSVNRDHALRVYEPIADFLLRYGVPAEDVMPLMAVFDNLVLGSAIQPFSAGFAGDLAEYARRYPALSLALSVGDRDRIDDLGFELGLTAFLDHVRALAVTSR